MLEPHKDWTSTVPAVQYVSPTTQGAVEQSKQRRIDTPQTQLARDLSKAIDKVALPVMNDSMMAYRSIVVKENLNKTQTLNINEVLGSIVIDKLADIVANMALLHFSTNEGNKVKTFKDHIVPLIEYLDYENIERLIRYGILPKDEEEIDYRELLNQACVMYKKTERRREE